MPSTLILFHLSSQNQINEISQIAFDKFPLTLLCLPIMASCTEGGCKIYLISTLIHGTMHITQCNALNNNVLLQMDIFPNSSMNKICLNHITRVTKSASFSTSSTFRFAAYRSAIFKFVMTFRLLSVGQMWSFFGNTWSAIGDLKQNLIPFSEAPHLIWTKKHLFLLVDAAEILQNLFHQMKISGSPSLPFEKIWNEIVGKSEK